MKEAVGKEEGRGEKRRDKTEGRTEMREERRGKGQWRREALAETVSICPDQQNLGH